MNPIGPLLPQDEAFCHQIVDTFATVGTTDRDWTEKVCAMACARDGSLQIGFGLGKYTNRNVLDAYAGVSRGVEQITVRGSRQLAPDPELMVIGPIRYEVVEPLKKIRFVLEPNDTQPIAFDWLFEAVVPPFMEDRTHMRTGYAVTSELVRYHQTGVASGWIEVDGVRTEMSPDTWASTRDHSWGARYGVGIPVLDMEPRGIPDGARFQYLWSPVLMERADGSRYGMFVEYNHWSMPGVLRKEAEGAIEHADGRIEHIVDIDADLHYADGNRRLLGGTLHCTMEDGSTRDITYEAVSDTGFHLGTGLYFGFDGHYHGEWRGLLHVDGERIDDCSTFDNARRVHQIRDTVVHVHDPVAGATGWGNAQPILTGGPDSFM